jgi:uncharacterized protein (TIGR03032 family)
MDVSSGEMISRGLSMPHAPRLHDGRLWLLESGTGQHVLADAATGHRQMVASLPGFSRGLALCGPYAFIGLIGFQQETIQHTFIVPPESWSPPRSSRA